MPDGCSEEGLEAACDAARANGVVVEGSAVEAIGWEVEIWLVLWVLMR